MRVEWIPECTNQLRRFRLFKGEWGQENPVSVENQTLKNETLLRAHFSSSAVIESLSICTGRNSLLIGDLHPFIPLNRSRLDFINIVRRDSFVSGSDGENVAWNAASYLVRSPRHNASSYGTLTAEEA